MVLVVAVAVVLGLLQLELLVVQGLLIQLLEHQ
jgi:hypothetical protein